MARACSGPQISWRPGRAVRLPELWAVGHAATRSHPAGGASGGAAHIDAELSIWEQGREVWSEEAFPVAELAYHLALWLRSPAAGHEDFELDSMQADPGMIRIGNSDEGWRIGSILTPEFSTSPVAWDVLVAEIRHFDRSVREGIAAMGIDPAFIPEPQGCSDLANRVR